MTESIPQYAPVCVFNLNDLPLGFGVAARGTLQTKELEPTAVVIFNQADTGEYLRTEDDWFCIDLYFQYDILMINSFEIIHTFDCSTKFVILRSSIR